MKNLHRIYIDEVGNHDMKENISEDERFLTLFGVIVNGHHMQTVIQPDMRKIKEKYFKVDPDEPIIFHRKDIARRRGPFKNLLKDKFIRDSFGNDMLVLYRKWDFTAISITIDKKSHFNKYSVWRYEPYHYCLAMLIERYVLYLHYRKLRGDVMIEARGTAPDKKLKESFRRLFEQGTRNLSSQLMEQCLTSREIKVKNKKANVEGLQLADLLAHAAHYDLLSDKNYVSEQSSEYSKEIVKILMDRKYNRHSLTGIIDGYGKKMLP